MKFITKNLPRSELEIEVIIPFAEFESSLKKAAVLLSEEKEIEGFRKGKAPYEVVKNKFDETAIYERAAELTIRQNYIELIKKVSAEPQRKDFTQPFEKYPTARPQDKSQSSLSEDVIPRNQRAGFTPIGRPEITITKLAPGNDLEFKIRIASLPEIELPDYKSIAQKIVKNKKFVSVEEAEIQKTLDWIRESRAPLITVDRPAQKGDAVEIDFETKQGGVKIEGLDSKNHPLTIGQNRFIPGLEDQLMGMKAGEEKNFTLTVPEDWHDKNLAGKNIDFRAVMKLVQEKKIPELNDEFAKSVGSFSSLEELKKNVQEGLTQEKETRDKQKTRSAIIEEIISPLKTELPEVLITSELAKMLQELKNGIENMRMNWADYLLHIKKSEEDLKKEWRGEAEKRVRAALALRQIALREKIEPSAEEIETGTNQYLSQFETPEEARKKIDPEELKEYTKGILRNEKVFEFLENI